MNPQFKKGVLKLCVLAMLEGRDLYGYELVQQISENIQISEGTIYPLLKNLKEQGFVTTYLKESAEGPSRKYYKLTAEGEKEKNQLKKDWIEFASSVSKLLNNI